MIDWERLKTLLADMTFDELEKVEDYVCEKMMQTEKGKRIHEAAVRTYEESVIEVEFEETVRLIDNDEIVWQ